MRFDFCNGCTAPLFLEMKRFLLCLLIFVSTVGHSFAQSSVLFDKYSQIEGVEGMVVGKSMMKLAILAAKGDEKAMLKKVERMDILNFEQSSADVQNRYLKEIASLKELEFLGEKEEKGVRTICYAVTDKTVISRVLIITADSVKNQFVSMDLYGSIPVSLLEKLAH